jgi:hypothetical protein
VLATLLLAAASLDRAEASAADDELACELRSRLSLRWPRLLAVPMLLLLRRGCTPRALPGMLQALLLRLLRLLRLLLRRLTTRDLGESLYLQRQRHAAGSSLSGVHKAAQPVPWQLTQLLCCCGPPTPLQIPCIPQQLPTCWQSPQKSAEPP